MCYQIKCQKCGKTTWDGCGNHATSAMQGVPKEQVCQCKPIPPDAAGGCVVQ